MTGCLGLLGGGHSSPTVAGGGGGAFNAATYGTVLAWYDMTDSSKVQDNVGATVGNGGAVDRVVDKSSNALDARQTSGAARPTVVTSSINGLQALDFNGSTQLLQLPSSTALYKNLTGITIVGVYNGDDFTVAQSFLNIPNPTGIRVRVRHLGGSTDSQMTTRIQAQDAGTDDEFYKGSGIIVHDTWYIFITVIDFVGNTLKCWYNGTQAGTTVTDIHSSGNCSNTNSGDVPTIGSHDQFGAGVFNGQIAEVIIYNGALADGSRDPLETALGTKYSLTVV